MSEPENNSFTRRVARLRHKAIMSTSLLPDTLLVGEAEARILVNITRDNFADITVDKETILDGSMRFMGLQVLGVAQPSWLSVAYCTTETLP